MKRRTFAIATHDCSRVPCAGWEFDAGGGIMLVAHRALLAPPDGFGSTWCVSDPVSGRRLGEGYWSSRSIAVREAHGIVKRLGADNARARLERLARDSA